MQGAAPKPMQLPSMPCGQCYLSRPQQFLYFLPLPQGHGSLRPMRGPVWRMVTGA